MESEEGLFKLPTELRIEIYEYLLRFAHPIKLRTLVPGSPHTALLRVSRRWYHDALPVLYSLNRVVATRNDFCSHTDESLKTPLFGIHLQHLLITNFGSSMACYFNEKCTACEIAAPGLLAAIKSMPHLKTVLVDFTSQQSSFQSFARALPAAQPDLRLECTAVGSYRLIGPSVSHLSFRFQLVPLARVWPTLTSLVTDPSPTPTGEEETLAQLRAVNPSMVDRAWLAIWLQKHRSNQLPAAAPTKHWVDDVDLVGLNEYERSVELHRFTEELLSHLKDWTPEASRDFLRFLRTAPEHQLNFNHHV